LNLEENSSIAELAKAVIAGWAMPLQPVLLANAPVKENIVSGDAVDLTKFPIPWWSRIDAGRFLGTWHLNITRDPVTGERNIGVYRMQLLTANTAAVSFSPKSHLAQHLQKAQELGQSLEMAVAIGVDERLIMAAAAAPPYGVDEYTLAGGLAQKPVELTQCLTVSNEVPAHSEIVIEGYIDPRTKVMEGPYLDYAGIPSCNPEARLFRAEAVMYRNGAIFRGTAVGRPGAEDHMLYSLLANAKLADFHGSPVRQRLQNYLLRRGSFRLFQFTGRIHRILRRGSM
jgi:4-hydroxy-3-polyprenylbenzoate decarboxylase